MGIEPDPEQMFRRFMVDCFAQVSAEQWRKRAQDFRDARPRPEDFAGRTTIEERRERWRRLTATAKACDLHAQILEEGATFPDVDDFLEREPLTPTDSASTERTAA